MRIFAKRKVVLKNKFRRNFHAFNAGGKAAKYEMFELTKYQGRYVWNFFTTIYYKYLFIDNEALKCNFDNAIELKGRRLQTNNDMYYLVFKESDLEHNSNSI